VSVEVDVARFTLGPIRRGASAACSKSSSRLPGTMLVVEALDAQPLRRPSLSLTIAKVEGHASRRPMAWIPPSFVRV
jgi:hypothetical protein